jgi:SAM-dependent methyltransferase
MTGFSVDWLASRERADVRARAPALAAMLGSRLAPRQSVAVVDLGCGTGANLRATSALLGPYQSWQLVDHDRTLLDEASARLSRWADAVESAGQELVLRKGKRRIAVSFRRADLESEIEHGGFRGIDLVTASALFDLVSAELIQSLAGKVTRGGALFYAVLTYDGTQSWTPPHQADERILGAFNAHQLRDKGMGPAAGGAACRHLAASFAASGASCHGAASPWLLGPADAKLVDLVAAGVADAARETGLVGDAEIAAWLAVPRTGCRIGHQDLLAVPD